MFLPDSPCPNRNHLAYSCHDGADYIVLAIIANELLNLSAKHCHELPALLLVFYFVELEL